MLEELPLDSDGDALRSLIATGSDLSKEMEIDFAMSVPNREAGLAFATIVGPMGFQTSISLGDATKTWTCYCSRIMVPSYEAIIEVQRILEKTGKPYNARPDGWGSFGNGEV